MRTNEAEPRVTVVTVCRNALPVIAATLDSVVAQRYAAKFHIVIDGVSTDGTHEYLRSRRESIDVLVSEPDAGIYDAMNKAVDRCPNDSWVIFLNAGDKFADSLILQRLADDLLQAADVVVGDVIIEGAAGNRRVAADLGRKYRMPACHQAMLFRASVLKACKFNLDYAAGADFDCFMRIKNQPGAARIARYPGVISQIAPEGFTARNEARLRRDYFEVIARHWGRNAARRWLLERKLRQWVRKWLMTALGRRQ
jgi:glycosyltransferase involved in cell wall biosynthesis